MTDEEHDLWEALAVGHAMRALEPADDALFRDHLATCERCAGVLAESEALMGALATAAEPMEPPPALRERVLAISRDADTGDRVAPVVDELAGRRVRRRLGLTPVVRWAAVAAVVGAVAASGVTYAVVHQDKPTSTIAAQCFLTSDCQHMPLESKGGAIGAVVLEQGKAYIMSPGLLPANGSDDQYVVWTGDASGKMTALTAFRVTGKDPFHMLDKVPDLTVGSAP